MKTKIQAGAEIETITKDEVRELLKASQTSWFNEVAKGDRYKRFAVQSTVLADGTVTFGNDAHNQVGPNDGFVWSLKRVNFVVAGFDPTSNATYLYLNDPNPSSMIRQLSDAYTQFGNNEVVR